MSEQNKKQMPQILITQAEVNNHSSLSSMFNSPQTMTCNGISCVYTDISQTDLDSVSSSLDSDAWNGVVLPKHVVEG